MTGDILQNAILPHTIAKKSSHVRKHIVTIAYIRSDIFMSHEGPKGGTSLFTETGTLLFTDYNALPRMFFLAGLRHFQVEKIDASRGMRSAH